MSNTFENSTVRSESIQKLHDLQLLQSMYASQNLHFIHPTQPVADTFCTINTVSAISINMINSYNKVLIINYMLRISSKLVRHLSKVRLK